MPLVVCSGETEGRLLHEHSGNRLRRFIGPWAAALLLYLAARPGFTQARYSVSDEDAGASGSPRVVVLRDSIGGFEAAVAPSQGGELSSFRVRFKGRWLELLYHARDYTNARGFQGKAPVLWPAVGMQFPLRQFPVSACGDGSWQFDGKTWPMPCHGFAKSLPWAEVARSAGRQGASVTVELRDSDRTRQFYPFGFRLDTTYTLSGGQLTIDYSVKADAANTQPMVFSIGNHIAFRLPLVPGTDPAAVTFESPSATQMLRNPLGFVIEKEKPRSFATPERLGDFDAHVALPLAGYRGGQPYAVLRDPQGLSVRVIQQSTLSLPEPLVRFNVYGGPRQGYFSPEPWFGLQNSLNLGQPLVHLVAGDTWTWRVELKATGPAPDSPESAGVERFGGGFGYVEGPAWSKQGYLLFSDMLDSKILKITKANHIETWRQHSNGSNGNAFDAQGRLYSCERDGRRVVRMEKDGHLTVIASEYEGKRLNDPNDVVVRRDGQVYFTDSRPDNSLQHFELDYAGLYHVTPDGKVALIAKMARPNGVTLTPDGRTLYVDDTSERTVIAYALDNDGNPSERRVLISKIDGGPDGLRVAANGNIYIAARGIAVYSPQGELLRTIEFPETPANCTFGDRDLKTLYVTARTSVYRVRILDKGYLLY